MNIGLVGCGFIALKRHVPSAMEVEGMRIAAVCDLDPGRAAALAAKIGAVPYSSIDPMLAREKLAGVIIATSPDTHVPLALRCLSHGVPVLVEKPPGVTLEDARRLAEAEEESGLPVLVGFNKRSAPVYREAKALVDCAHFRMRNLNIEYSSGAWGKPVPEMCIDLAMVWHHIHGFDLARFFGGEVENLRSYFCGSHEGQGCYTTLLRLVSGALCTLVTSSYQLWQHPFERVEMVGEGEFLVVENFRQIRHCTGEGQPAKLTEPNYSIQEESGNALEGFVPQLSHFLRCIRREEYPVSTAADACRSLELVHLAIRSAVEEKEMSPLHSPWGAATR